MKEIKTLEQKQAFELGVTYLKSYLIFCNIGKIDFFKNKCEFKFCRNLR